MWLRSHLPDCHVAVQAGLPGRSLVSRQRDWHALIDAKLTWTVALVAIVGGHVISIWRAHRLALSVGLSVQHTALTTLPLTLLMLVYTSISLMVLAAPMVNNAP